MIVEYLEIEETEERDGIVVTHYAVANHEPE